MTRYVQREVICAICKAASRFSILTSTTTFGSPDLDLRPPMLARSTLVHQVQICPHCGYCGFDLGQAPSAAANLVRTVRYQQQLFNPDLPPEANALLCLSLLREASGDERGAAHASLQAAWLCDDAGNAEGSLHARLQAAALLQRVLQGGPAGHSKVGVDTAILVDVLRRAGEFAAARVACEKGRRRHLSPMIQQVLAFQGKLIQEQDTSCYLLADVTG